MAVKACHFMRDNGETMHHFVKFWSTLYLWYRACVASTKLDPILLFYYPLLAMSIISTLKAHYDLNDFLSFVSDRHRHCMDNLTHFVSLMETDFGNIQEIHNYFLMVGFWFEGRIESAELSNCYFVLNYGIIIYNERINVNLNMFINK